MPPLKLTITQIHTDRAPLSEIDRRKFTDYVIRGVRPKRPHPPENAIPDTTWHLATSCWAPEPSDRPSVDSIRGNLLTQFSIQDVPSQIPQDDPLEMREQNCVLQREMAALKEENKRLLLDAEQQRREAGAAQQQAQQQLDHERLVNAQIHNKWMEARREAEENARKLQQLQSEHSSTKARLESQDDLLASRTRELTVAQRYLTTADSLPGADVIQMVTKLNNDILQCAAHLADTLPKTARFEPTDSDNVNAAYTRVLELGNDIFNLLKSRQLEVDPSTTLQIAFQTCFIHSCSSVISSWHNDDTYDYAFKSLYHQLRRTGRSATDVLGHPP